LGFFRGKRRAWSPTNSEFFLFNKFADILSIKRIIRKKTSQCLSHRATGRGDPVAGEDIDARFAMGSGVYLTFRSRAESEIDGITGYDAARR